MTPRQLAGLFILALLLVDAWITVAVVRALRTGAIRNLGRFQRGMIAQADSPWIFWTTLAAYVVTGVFLAILAINLLMAAARGGG